MNLIVLTYLLLFWTQIQQGGYPPSLVLVKSGIDANEPVCLGRPGRHASSFNRVVNAV
ncbi:MAG: hypothetical protein VKK04_12005 [Synechococcales bacterium]|nr:hypothetical protein [Synechococcales bacterium]